MIGGHQSSPSIGGLLIKKKKGTSVASKNDQKGKGLRPEKLGCKVSEQLQTFVRRK